MTNELSTSQEGFLGYFFKLPEKTETTIRFFNRTDFYTVHGADALVVAKEVFKSTNNVKIIGSGDKTTESVIFNKNQFERLVRDLLLVKQYRVEVYVGRGNTWSLEYKGSPGNLAQFEDLVFGLDVVAGGVVIGLKVAKEGNKRVIGVCAVSSEENSFNVCHIEDDDGCTGLEGLLVQIVPKEVVIPDSGDYVQISKVAKRCGMMVVQRKSSTFTTDGFAEDLNRLLLWKSGQAENCLALPELQLQTACAALNATLQYLELAKDETNLNQFSLKTLTPHHYVHVDSSAAKALGLLAGSGSLITHLDRCRTAPGKRLLSQWIKQPLRDISRLNDRLNLVETLVADPELRCKLNDDLLRRFPDLQLLARRIQRKAATMHDCYKIYLAVERVTPLLEALRSAEQSPIVREELISPLEEYLTDMSMFQEMVTSTLDMTCVDRGEFLVKGSFSEELGELRERMDSLQKNMEKELENCAKNLDMEAGKSIKLDSTAQHGFFFRTTNKKEVRNIRSCGDLKIIDGKSGVRFQSKALTSLSSEYIQIQREYNECQKTIVQEIINIAAGYSGAILSLSHVLSKLDVLTGFAVVAANAPIPYVRPKLLSEDATSGRLFLKEARHPVMEALDSMSFIPNDVDMNQDRVTFEIITGPNMGGKSTFLRTIGTCALLAHVGSFVPCAEAELTVLDAILARVGAGDCQIAGVSTFMNEMVDTASILKRATKRSLVLIDELGRGTSTYEGCGLAWSIARELSENIKCFCLFATHFQELAILEKEVSSVTNRHVSAVATETGLTLLYQLKAGPSDRSFGIEVARMAKLPAQIIKDATEKLTELEQRQGLGISGVSLTTEEIEKGEELVEKFLSQVKTEGIGQLDNLRKKLLSENHRYIQAILN